MHPFLGAQECSINAILSFLFLVIGLFYFYIFLKISLYTSYSPPALAATAICTMLHLVQFSCSVTSDSLRSHGLQHTRLPCPSLSLGVCLNSCPSAMLSNHHILCCPLLLLPSIFPSIRIFSNKSSLCISWPLYWSFSFSNSTSTEYSGLISFCIDWFDLSKVFSSTAVTKD